MSRAHRSSMLAAVALLASAVLPSSLVAQRVTAGAHLAMAQYAEQGTSLSFAGGGLGATVSLHWRRLGLHVAATSLTFDPRESSSAAESFEAVQTDVRLRWRATRLVSLEAGFTGREVTPTYAAQSAGSMRVGALMSFPLAVGSDLAVRAGYLGASRFSGGGSAPFGVEIGLGVSHTPRWERMRFTGDLEFQRLDRRIDTAGGTLDAPIQSAMARVGLAVAF